MNRRIAALSLAVTFLILTSTAFATDRHVPGTYPTIQEAINAAAVGDTVVITNLPGTAQARSVYAITDRNSKVKAYDIQDYQLMYQTYAKNLDHHGYGAVGLALDPCSATLFVTYEESNLIEMVNARTMMEKKRESSEILKKNPCKINRFCVRIYLVEIQRQAQKLSQYFLP